MQKKTYYYFLIDLLTWISAANTVSIGNRQFLPSRMKCLLYIFTGANLLLQ